ncbi:unnamed protein product [Caenorhabditis auriculariae]|uniref:Tetraspanin n=1 Tax=Caenorhabditis auriculariae TaxID=2777116 RepID=A0A8S1HJ32_9PELO|nr:unnamed protein product [Caenorhabditis auriculariae]
MSGYGRNEPPSGIYQRVMGLHGQDKVLIVATFATAVVGAALIVVGFILRFGGGFATFSTYAQKDNDFLELKRLDMIFGLFVAAAGILILSFFLAVYAAWTQNKFLLRAYCAIIGLMIVVQLVAGLLSFTYSDQINQLASDDILYESLYKAASKINGKGTGSSNDEVQFWSHTQDVFACCGVLNSQDWLAAAVPMNQLDGIHCYQPHYNDGCEKKIRSRISGDAQYLGAASMGVLVVELIACFLAGYRAYNLAHPEFNESNKL